MQLKKLSIGGGVIGLTVLAISCASTLSRRVPSGSFDSLTIKEQQVLSKSVARESEKLKSDGNEFFILNETELQALPGTLEKLGMLLHKPVIKNTYSQNTFINAGVDRKSDRNEVRLTTWNIERGQNFENLIKLFSFKDLTGRCDRAKISSQLNWKDQDQKSNKRSNTIDEVCALNETDILLLNEADLGVCRSGYRDVAAELADHLKMNYAYAPSFFEAEPSKTGLVPSTDPFCKNENLTLTKNLTGNALLSRYPLSNVKVVPLPIGYVTKDGDPTTKEHNDTYCYDWHQDEIQNSTLVDKAKKIGAKYIFDEKIIRELRYGSRNAIIADVTMPNGGTITVVAAHLENKAKPSCRQAQMRYLLKRIETSFPIVMGGDMNTTGVDGSRQKTFNTAWDLSLRQTAKNQNFWLNLFGWSNPITAGVGYGKLLYHKLTTTQNPTRVDIKWLRSNPEGTLFSFLKDQGFTWKGDSQFSLSGKDEGPWSTTNARDHFGFEGTHYLSRTYLTVGVSKLDWFFVNTKNNRCAQSKFPRTFGRIRSQFMRDEFPSDHIPISIMFDAPCF